MKIGTQDANEQEKAEIKVNIGRRVVQFEKVQSFIFLGTRVMDNYNEQSEIEARIAKGSKSFVGLKNIIKSKEVAKAANPHI